MSEDKTYTCAKCESALTDLNRMVCEAEDCTASLCVDCAVEVPEYGTYDPGGEPEVIGVKILCPICAGEEDGQ
jgi:hypothetical protein